MSDTSPDFTEFQIATDRQSGCQPANTQTCVRRAGCSPSQKTATVQQPMATSAGDRGSAIPFLLTQPPTCLLFLRALARGSYEPRQDHNFAIRGGLVAERNARDSERGERHGHTGTRCYLWRWPGPRSMYLSTQLLGLSGACKEYTAFLKE